MANKLVYTMIAVAGLGIAGSFNGCTCNGEAQLGKAAPAAPEPPPPAPPPAPVPVVVAPPPPPAAPAPKPIIAVGKAKIEGNKVKIPGELEFDVDKATLKDTPQTKDILNTLVEFMKENKSVTKLRIEGHTDNSGTPAHNKQLSQDRADAVAKYLGEHGCEKTRLTTVGFGDTKPEVANDTKENKAKNRRTEFHVDELDGKHQDAATTASSPPAPATPAPAAAAADAGAAPAITAPKVPGLKGPAAAPKKP
jgi:OmpA-OmpF porin, OOP family